MITRETQNRLQEIMRRESLSLLLYMKDAFPWTNARGSAALAQLQKIVHAEGEALNEMGKLLTKHRIGLRYIGTYPTSYTAFNFVALDFLLGRLITEARILIPALEADLAGLKDETFRPVVERWLQLKRIHLEEMEALKVSLIQPVSA